MRYVLTQKRWTLRDRFVIRDETGADAYCVIGRLFTIGQKLSFRDTTGRELAFIDQRQLSWRPTYAVRRGEEQLAVMKKHAFSPFKCRLTVDVSGSGDLEATGDPFDHEYEITRGGTRVATMSPQANQRRTYGIDIQEGEDTVLILSVAVVIELARYPRSGRQFA